MKPITEEQHKALIKFIGAAFESMKGNEPVNPDEFDIEEMTLQALEITLAALTAGPIGYCTKYDIEALQRGDAAGVSHVPNCHHPVYTAPPVPVIKFPNPHDIPDGYDLESCMATVQWYQSEVKRLNGLEQS